MGEIVDLDEEGLVSIDVGRTKGIEPGSVLAVQGRDEYHPQRLVVVSLEDDSCIAVEPNPQSSNAPLAVGMRVVTPK
jgi:hypothetical protein